MLEYIEREAAITAIRGRCDPCGEGIEALKSVPVVDVAPVRHGRWERRRFCSTDVICSECSTLETNHDSNYKSRYCPFCGAKMDGGEPGA